MILQSKFAVLVALLTGTVSAIRPTTNLRIGNGIIAPDGFRREYVDGPTLTVVHRPSISLQLCPCWGYVPRSPHHRQEGKRRYSHEPASELISQSTGRSVLGQCD